MAEYLLQIQSCPSRPNLQATENVKRQINNLNNSMRQKSKCDFDFYKITGWDPSKKKSHYKRWKSYSKLKACTESQQGFPGGSSGKESACQCKRCKRHRFDPWVGKMPGVGNGNPLQYSCLENSMDRTSRGPAVHRVTESDMTEHTWCMHTCTIIIAKCTVWLSRF